MNHLKDNGFKPFHMRHIVLMSALAGGLSTFLLTAQPQGGPGSMGTPATQDNPSGSTDKPNAEEKKPDINEIIKTSDEFTNSVGMVMKKTGGLWIATTEITQKAYQEIMNSNPSVFGGEKRPVDSVSWNDAMAFCDQLTTHEKDEDMLPDGYQYFLPTQEQWESLAAGVPLADAVTSAAGNRTGTSEVASLKPSADGLYDLRGNVSEWSSDPADGAFRVLRGGNWEDWIDVNLRLDFRIYEAPTVSKNTFGFRCVLIEGK